MTVSDLISKIVDSHVSIAVNEYKGNEHTGRRWIAERHESIRAVLPDDVLQCEVAAIVPYYDRISIEIEAK